MKRYRKILVPLELAESDRVVLAMVSRIAGWSDPQEIIFCHFPPKADLPAGLKETHPWMFDAIEKAALDKLHEEVHTMADLPDKTACTYHVTAGNPARGALGLILERDIDLVVVAAGPSNIGVRLARKATCSVCVVPADAPTNATKPLVPVDFSDHARHACEIAAALASANQSALPELLHISRIHTGYRWSTLSREEFIAMNDAHSQQEMERFAMQLDCAGEVPARHIHHHESVPFGILEFTERHGFDFIVAGCRGRDALSALLLGSDIEQVISHARVPVLAVKVKGTGRSFVEELLGMGD